MPNSWWTTSSNLKELMAEGASISSIRCPKSSKMAETISSVEAIIKKWKRSIRLWKQLSRPSWTMILLFGYRRSLQMVRKIWGKTASKLISHFLLNVIPKYVLKRKTRGLISFSMMRRMYGLKKIRICSTFLQIVMIFFLSDFLRIFMVNKINKKETNRQPNKSQ